MVNKTGNSWPMVPVNAADSVAMRKNSAVRFSPERRNELVNHENDVPPKTFYAWEKGTLIDIYA